MKNLKRKHRYIPKKPKVRTYKWGWNELGRLYMEVEG
jgi:hypothetical protein